MLTRSSWLTIFTGAARLIGAEVVWVDEFNAAGLIRLSNGKQTFFHRGVLDLNTVAAARIAQDKGYTTAYLRSLGLPVPEEMTFFRDGRARRRTSGRSLDDAVRFAKELGFPVFVKPAHLDQGRGVYKVLTVEEMEIALEHVGALDNVVLVQPAYAGRDYRIVVLDQEIVCAYERSPLVVTGDGCSTVGDLLLVIQNRFTDENRDTTLDLDDPRLHMNLKRLGLTFGSMPDAGQTVQLQDVANLSAGGSATDVTDNVHPSFAEMANNVAAGLNLRFCGIDIITADIALNCSDFTILEVNSAPGLDYYVYHTGNRDDHIERLYAKVLAAAGR